MPALAPPKGLGRLFTADTVATRRDDARDAQVRQLSKRVGPSAAPLRVNGVKFLSAGTGSSTSQPIEVEHLLGRPAQGYRVVNTDFPVMVSQSDSATPDTHVNLSCNHVNGTAAGDVLATVDLEVW